MANHRIDRLNEALQRELSALLRTVKDPRVTGMISVTGVEATTDLKYAKVYISLLDPSGAKEVMRGLRSASGYLRRELGRALELRAVPELEFIQDSSMDKGARIMEILRGLDKEEE